MRVLIYGNCVTQGFYDEYGGWATRLINGYLAEEIAKKNGAPTLFNLGISGDTTQNVLDRFEAETSARIDKSGDNALLFAIGTNDTIYRNQDYENSPEKFKVQLDSLLAKARHYTNKILFVSLFPVIDNLLQPFPWSSTGKCYSTERMRLFNDVLVKFCDENELPIVDLWNIFNGQEDLNGLFYDGLHPNNKGHELISNIVKPKLELLLRIVRLSS